MIWVILGLYLLYEIFMTISYFYWSEEKHERMGISKSKSKDK